MNQRQINAFRFVMRYGSITAAAQAMNLSQPAVSRLIQELEHHIGFALFLRTGGRARPTTEASEFIQEVERMFYGLDRLNVVAKEIKNLQRASLRVATIPMVSFEIVPKSLKQFLKAHPGARVTHGVHTSSRVLDLLASRQIDIGIAQSPGARSDLETCAAFRADCVCVLSADHPLASSNHLTPTDLRNVPLVALAPHTLTASYVSQCFAEAGINPNVVVETQPSYAACSLAAIGVGVAIVDPITPGIFGTHLRSVPFKPTIPFNFQILKSADVDLTRAAARFLDETMTTIFEMPEFGQTIHQVFA
jgi:DNA-binding transcriptional LysR family regulator